MTLTAIDIKQNNPFDLDNSTAYADWRERKLDNYPDDANDLIINVDDIYHLSDTELESILNCCRKTNMAIYSSSITSATKQPSPLLIGTQFELNKLDHNMGADDTGVTSLTVMDDESHGGYIPYTNRAIHWHTDGYYNLPQQQIQALLLHCVSPAASGGKNALLDHEIAYIHLRDTNPDYIRALMAPDVMTIPPNIKNNTVIRPARSGPVFSILNNGKLHMRYTARTRSIQWSHDPLTQSAVQALSNFLVSDSPYIHQLTLQPGQGLISNNVLHNRSGFDDDELQKRLLYRLRYFQRIANS